MTVKAAYQHTVNSLAHSYLMNQVEKKLGPIATEYEDLAMVYAPQAWEMWTDGKISAFDFFNRLVNCGAFRPGSQQDPIGIWAGQEIRERLQHQCQVLIRQNVDMIHALPITYQNVLGFTTPLPAADTLALVLSYLKKGE